MHTFLIAIALGLVVDVTDHGASGDDELDDREAIALALEALPPEGGVLYFPGGEYLTESEEPLVEVVDRDHVTLLGDGAGATRLRKLSPGTCVAIRGTSEIVGTRIADLSVLGGGVADRGIVCENLKDGEVERCAISGFRLHGIEGLGPATLNVMVRRTRITAPASALVEGCALSVRSGTSWRAEANYFNVGGTPESPRWGAIVDVRGHDGFFSQANVLDGAPTGIRSDGEITSVGDWWDVNASSGVWGYCYAHERNNRITIIGPRGPKKSKVDRSRFNARKWLTFVGGNRG